MSQNIDVFKPVRTKAGRKATIYNVNFNPDDEWPIKASVNNDDGGEGHYSYTREGIYKSTGEPSDDDMENVPETKTFWVNVYGSIHGHILHEDEQSAIA